MMKKTRKTSLIRIRSGFWCMITLMMITLSGFTQNVAINTTLSPADPSAGLDINFANKGFLVSRISLESTNSFAPLGTAHIAGMLVYNTATVADVKPGLYYDDGAKWIPTALPDGLAPGNLLYWNGTGWVTLPTGQPGQKLQLTSTGLPAWSNGALSALTTLAVTSITPTTAISGGSISSDGGTAVTEYGVCWKTSSGPTTADSRTIDGSGMGDFTSNLTGLLSGITYYVRAYATNNIGTAYGNEVSFTTP